MDIVVWIAGIGVALYALDRLGLWFESKGWLYYRKTRRTGSASGLFTGPDVFDPGIRHLENALEERVLEDEDDGDDDRKRKASDRLT